MEFFQVYNVPPSKPHGIFFIAKGTKSLHAETMSQMRQIFKNGS
jgi:hypothetical protein